MTKRKRQAPIVLETSRELAPADEMYLRVPLPPEVVNVVREHVERIGALFQRGRGVLELVTGTNDEARRFIGDCFSAAVAVERDVKRARKAMDGRRRRRKRAR